MQLDQLKQQAVEPLLLVPDATAALRWEAVWLGAEGVRGAMAAARPLISTPVGALAQVLERRGPEPSAGLPLSRVQATALWRKVVRESSQGQSLIGTSGPARAASEAWQLLHEWDVPWRSLRAPPDDPDFGALLDWCRAYDGLLRRNDWVDRGLVCATLADAPTQPAFTIASALPHEIPPAVARGLVASARSGAVHVIEPPRPAASITLHAARDTAAELQGVAQWLGERLAGGRPGPFAIVVPDARSRASEIETLLGDAGSAATFAGQPTALWLAGGRRLTEFGAPGAALNALELISGRGQFAQLSAWLRSPFFGSDNPGEHFARCRLETELRPDLVTQWPFGDAMQHTGLAGRIALLAPDTARRLRQALDVASAGGPLRLPVQWIECWEAVLRALGWRATAHGTTREIIAAWDRSLQHFASITPVLGRMDAATAIAELRGITDSQSVRGPMPVHGIHVFERAIEVGPGYAGIWMCGYTERQWPAPMRLAPLLPGRLLRAHAMPYATPEDAHRRSLAELHALLRHGAEIVLSAPAEVDDAPMRASRMLGDLPAARVPAGSADGGYARLRMGTRALRTLTDPVPAAAIDEIGGGTRLLELQASCPVRAFCELRLAARPLERIRRGIHPRVRGIALHRALELLFRPVAGTGPFPVAGRREGIAEAAAAALAAAIPWTTPPWDLIAALEVARAGRALGALLDREAVRGSMEVAAVEVRTRLAFGRYALTGRIDRVDLLPSGHYVIIDYKTGQAPTAAAWMDERLTAPQLPAYAVTMPEAVAFVVAAIGDGRVDYRAVGDLPADHPARPRPALAHGEWQQQVGRWRAQIEQLLDEFAAGDVRIDPDSTALAAGDYAPLTRVHAAQESRSHATASEAND